MIAHLRGELAGKHADHVVVDVGGVGYLVRVSTLSLAAFPAVGQPVKVLTVSHTPQDGGTELFGFATEEERELFGLLIGVQGVGPKVALGILSGCEPGELETAIARGDVARLKRLKGVGPRLAERLVVELKGKVFEHAGGAAPRAIAASPGRAPAPSGPAGDVAQALVALGYKPAEAERAAERAIARLGTPGDGAARDAVLREALRLALEGR